MNGMVTWMKERLLTDGKRNLEVFKKRALELESTHTRFWRPEDEVKANKTAVKKIFASGIVPQPAIFKEQGKVTSMEEVKVHATARTTNEFRCFKCNKQGHVAKNCTRTIICSRCNRAGHKASECRSALTCFECGREGHLQQDCRATRNVDYGRREPCRTCERTNHTTSECWRGENSRNRPRDRGSYRGSRGGKGYRQDNYYNERRR